MPIGFEPMQPMDERVYAAYGAAQARAADRDFALKAGAQAQQSAHQSSQLAQQDEHFVEQQRQQASLAQQQMAHQSAMQDEQHAAAFGLQQNRQNFEFTQADNLRLQRINQDAAGWEQLRQTNEITPDEYQQGIQMLNRQQMPLQARRDAAQEQHIRRQNELLATQQAAQTTRDDAHRRFLARTGPLQQTDDNGIAWVQTGPEKWERVKDTADTSQPKPMTEGEVARLRIRLNQQVNSDPAWMGRPESARRARVAELETLARQQASGENLPPAQPITATTREEESALPAYQRQGLRDLESLNNTLNATNSGLTDEQRREVRRDFDLAQNLFRQYGGLLEMPSTERRSFSAAMRSLTQLNDQVTARGRVRPTTTRPPPANYSGPVDNARPGDANYASPYGQ